MTLSARLGAFFSLAAALLSGFVASAERLSIISQPPGATVTINGVSVGATPFTKEYPGGYFHRTITALGSRLRQPLVARLSMAGYATKEIVLTEGPMEWIGLRGVKHGEYWLIKSTHFEVVLDSTVATFTGSVKTAPTDNGASSPDLSISSLTAAVKPAVVQLIGRQKMGTGFFVTDTGIIATNAHLAREEGTLLVELWDGVQLEGSVVYVDSDLDIALVKVPGKGFKNLTLAAADTVRQGESVVAIGNPGDAMQFSATNGIVSAVGKFPNAGQGTWVQTDAPINPGNSGGPLLNLRGEVIGISTLKLIKKGVTGIGFALSASDLLSVLSRFYELPQGTNAKPAQGAAPSPEAAPLTPPNSARSGAKTGTVLFRGPEGTTILIDAQIVG